MASGRGTSLSGKMIFTTTGLILVIVGLFGSVDASHMGRTFDEQSRRLNETILDAINRRGEVQTRDLVQSSRGPILQSDYSTLQSFVPQLVTRGDRELAYAFVADENGTIVAHTDAARNLQPVKSALDRELLASPEPTSKRATDGGKKLLAFSRPILQEKERKGTVVIAFDLAPLDEQIEKIEVEKRQAARASTLRTAIIGLVFVLFGTALAVFQALRISRPLRLLAWRADQIAHGDLVSRVPVESSDEIGRLGESFNSMADHLSVLLTETAKKAVLEKELEVARAIQDTLVPSSELVSKNGIEVAGYFQPSSECGGDWWTVHELDGDRLLVVIGDVTGHGAPAAMITACAKAACDTIRAVAGDRLTASYLLDVLNHAVYESARRTLVMTCFAAVIDHADPKKRTITFANAGHNFPYLYRASATGEGEFQVLMARGNRLGDVVSSSYAEKTQALEPGDVLVFYTDGIVECESEAGEEYGEKRFRAAIKERAALGTLDLRDGVVRAAGDFYGAQPRKDDITLVACRVAR